MRMLTATGLALASLLSIAPAYAQNNNDLMGQARRFFSNDSEQNAYVRGREDEMRAEQNRGDRERYSYRRDTDNDTGRHY